ncbi:MAG: SUMF1/EgtB/PvdO family nonheme iron enzyme [bacterium]
MAGTRRFWRYVSFARKIIRGTSLQTFVVAPSGVNASKRAWRLKARLQTRRCELKQRVLRGGSWNNNPDNLRCANRNRNNPTNRNDNVGFRCVQDAEAGYACKDAGVQLFTDN